MGSSLDVMDALALIETKRDYPLGDDEVRLGRDGLEIDLFLKRRIRRIITAILE